MKRRQNNKKKILRENSTKLIWDTTQVRNITKQKKKNQKVIKISLNNCN